MRSVYHHFKPLLDVHALVGHARPWPDLAYDLDPVLQEMRLHDVISGIVLRSGLSGPQRAFLRRFW